MAESETRPTGWHPDPDDPSMLRHWNGRRWGKARRPRPSWAGSGEEEPAAEGRSGGRITSGPTPGWPRRWWMWMAGAAVVVLGVPLLIVTTGNRGPELPPRTVEDQAFASQANATCERVLVPLREERPQRGEDRQLRNEAAVAGRIDRTADGLSQLTTELRRLPVAAADREEITRWLTQWDDYVSVGRRYAEALRRSDQRTYGSITEDGNRLGREIFVFAKANGMPACTP